MARLAAGLRQNVELKDALAVALGQISEAHVVDARERLKRVQGVPGGVEFLGELDELAHEFMDITYGSERLLNRLDLLLHTILELAADPDRGFASREDQLGPEPNELERRFLENVAPARRAEAAEVLRIGRVSWQLRDDDNLLLSRVESQLFRAVDLAVKRLRAAGRLHGEPGKSEEMISAVAAALVDEAGLTLDLPAVEESGSDGRGTSKERPRQIVGQPASPGLAAGKVRRITAPDDSKVFRTGEVLVCDAIQPMMTHLVPLAAGIVERRGGMLIHGAIIAREMQIPCVNGIARAVDQLQDGEIVTVDGYLGIVTVGPPEFDLELR
jgi:pyruvate,water dikinase